MTIALIESYTDKPWRSPETFARIRAALEARWRVIPIRTRNPEELRALLEEAGRVGGGDVFVFNIAEYLDEEAKSGFVPALLDGWGIPHLGSSAAAAEVALDKAWTKRTLLARGVPTPPFFTAERIDAAKREEAERIGYPLFVKPVGEGGHIGIGDDSVVRDAAALAAAVERIAAGLGQPALVEKYVSEAGMREFSVGVLDGACRLFTPIEIDWDSMEVGAAILSHAVAMNDGERVKLVADEEARARVVDLAAQTFDAVGARDYARIDIRMNETGYYVLEINAMPGLGPHSFLPEAAEAIHGLDYPRLIRKLAEDSMRRQGLL
jgi:D-alanine-D-alanine ligase